MSCRTTKGGTLALRLARHYSGLPDNQVQRLFHALLREGDYLPDPDQIDLKDWQTRQRALVRYSELRPHIKERCDRELFLAQTENPTGAVFHAWSRIELRARQEAVLAAVAGAVDLEPPGSQADQYILGDDGRPTEIWYASYGSNMNKDRFLTYIQGGAPEGSNTVQSGARDKTEPTGDIPIRFDGRMHFAYMSSRWGNGGVAFMDVDHAGHALGRAYKITSAQFDDVVAQENGRTPGVPDKIDLATVLTEQSDEVSKTALYGTVLHIGDYHGAPVLTFTGGFSAGDALEEAAYMGRGDVKANWAIAANSPHGNYLRMIGSGLAETFNMTDTEQADYLRGCSGAEDWTRREMLTTLRAAAPTPIPVRAPVAATAADDTLFARTYPGGTVAYTAAPSAASLAGVGITPKPTAPWSGFAFGNTPTLPPVNQHTPPAPTPLAMPRFHSPTRVCPLCEKPGHSMHDCHLLAKATVTVAAPRDPKPRTPKPRTQKPRTPAPPEPAPAAPAPPPAGRKTRKASTPSQPGTRRRTRRTPITSPDGKPAPTP